MRISAAPGAIIFSTTVVLSAAILQGCNPDESSMQRVAQSRLGAPAATSSTATLPDDPAASKRRPYQAAGNTQAPASSSATTGDLGMPVYPNARRILTGSDSTTVSGVETESLTTQDSPEDVLKFYARFYPKPAGKHPLPGSPTWTTSDDVNGASTRITLPDPSAEGAMHVVEVSKQRTETVITLMHVDGTPLSEIAPSSQTTLPPSGPPSTLTSPGSTSGLPSGASPSSGRFSSGSSGGLSVPPASSSLPAHSSLGGFASPGSTGGMSPPAGGNSTFGSSTGSTTDHKPHL